MTRALTLVLLAVASLTLLATGVGAQTPQPSQELPSVEGAANPLDAPLVAAGSVVDTILQSETLWYAVDAGPGQRVGVAVTVVGRPDGPEAEDTLVEVSLTDPQRQPVAQAEVEFNGQEEATADVPAQEILPVGGEHPLVSVGLRSPSGQTDLEGVGYRVQLTVTVAGTPLPSPNPAAGTPGGPAATPGPAPTVTAPPLPPPGEPQPIRDLAPIALVALALGGFAGFEFSRRGL